MIDEITKADGALADKAYDADERMRDKLNEKGCIAVIPPRSNRNNPAKYDKDNYKKVKTWNGWILWKNGFRMRMQRICCKLWRRKIAGMGLSI